MGIDIDDSGLNQLRENLENMKEMEEGIQVPITEILDEEFLRRYTKARDFSEFITESGLVEPSQPITKEVFAAIPDGPWNEYVRKETPFSSWNDMLDQGAAEYVKKRLFRGI